MPEPRASAGRPESSCGQTTAPPAGMWTTGRVGNWALDGVGRCVGKWASTGRLAATGRSTGSGHSTGVGARRAAAASLCAKGAKMGGALSVARPRVDRPCETFRPTIRAYTDRGADAPDTRSPRAFLWWMVRQNGGLFWAGLLVALIWMVPQTVGPWMVGRAIDTGIVAGDSAATTRWVAGARRGHRLRRRERHRLPHRHRARVAHRPLRHDQARHPQGPPARPRPDPPHADGRGALGLGQRRRPVRRAHGDHDARHLPARRLPRRGRHRAQHVGAHGRPRARRRRRCSCCSARRCCDRCSAGRASSARATPS